MASALRAFVQCVPGVEGLLLRELAELGVGRRVRAEAGGVSLWAAGQRELWTLATQTLIADAIRVRVGGTFRATNFEQLINGTRRSVAPALRAFAREPSALDLRVRCKRSRLWHTDAVAQRVAETLSLGARERLAARGEEDPPPLVLSMRLLRDEVEASIEAASTLHVRGCKPHATDSQLNETVAAACVRAALESVPDVPPAIWDPFCGSGTLLLEAALLFARRRTGSALVGARLLTAERLPLARFAAHDGEGYAAFLRQAVASAEAPADPAVPRCRLYASDASERAARACAHNAQHALGEQGVTVLGALDFERAAALVPDNALVLANIPWRVHGPADAEARLYARLGAVLRARARVGARVFVLSGNERFVQRSGCSWRALVRCRVGGAPAHFLQLEDRR